MRRVDGWRPQLFGKKGKGKGVAAEQHVTGGIGGGGGEEVNDLGVAMRTGRLRKGKIQIGGDEVRTQWRAFTSSLDLRALEFSVTRASATKM